MMRILLGLALCVVSLPALGQEPEQPVKTTLCQIKAAPMSFNKKLVEVSGYATHGFEDSMFEDPTCFLAQKFPGIWMEYGGPSSTDTMYCCGFKPSDTREKPLVIQDVPVSLVRDERFQRLDKMLHVPANSDVSVRATVLARIFVKPPQFNAWPNRFLGYGHMGCCMLLVIQQVKSVDSVQPEKSIFDLAHDFEKKQKSEAQSPTEPKP